MSAFSFIGKELLTKAGVKPAADVLAGKDFVLLYFSASWCPPCQRFTPQLAEFYKKHKDAKNFEIVFVSADRDEAGMKAYYNEKMPWSCIPYAAAERTKVSSKYCGEGIPDLCIFGKGGEVIKRGAVQSLMSDTAAKNFPWPPPTWAQCVPETLIKKDGSTVSKDALKGKTIGVYCSAEWCPPCRQFTPLLGKFYAEYLKADPNFEIIFASSDKTADAMKKYFEGHHGDYLCMPYDCKEREVMKEYVDAQGIPTFAVYSPEGKLINKGGRNRVSAGVASVVADGWAPPALGNLADGTEAAGSDLNETMSVMVNVAGCDDDEQDDIEKELKVIAKEYAAAAPEGEAPEVIFFISKTDAGIAKKLAEVTKPNGSKRCGAAGNDAHMLCLNLGDDGAFYESAETDITVENVRKFVKSIQDGSAKRLQAVF